MEAAKTLCGKAPGAIHRPESGKETRRHREGFSDGLWLTLPTVTFTCFYQIGFTWESTDAHHPVAWSKVLQSWLEKQRWSYSFTFPTHIAKWSEDEENRYTTWVRLYLELYTAEEVKPALSDPFYVSDCSDRMFISDRMGRLRQTVWIGACVLATGLRTLKWFTEIPRDQREAHFYSQVFF